MSSEVESEKRKRTTEEANWARRYSIQCIEQSMILYNHGEKGENEQPKRVVKKEELFDVLTSTHKRLGHAGRDLMWKELRGDYHGISNEILEIFVKLCPECELKKGTPKKEVVVKPMITKEQNERCQVDLIVLQSVCYTC